MSVFYEKLSLTKLPGSFLDLKFSVWWYLPHIPAICWGVKCPWDPCCSVGKGLCDMCLLCEDQSPRKDLAVPPAFRHLNTRPDFRWGYLPSSFSQFKLNLKTPSYCLGHLTLKFSFPWYDFNFLIVLFSRYKSFPCNLCMPYCAELWSWGHVSVGESTDCGNVRLWAQSPYS